MVKMLLKYKANADIANKYGQTPLLLALLNNNTEIASILLEVSKKSINYARLSDKVTPLIAACGKGNIEIVKKLLNIKEINIECKTDKNVTPLMISARYNHLCVVQELLKKNACVNHRSNKGKSAIYFGRRNTEIRELLVTRYFKKIK